MCGGAAQSSVCTLYYTLPALIPIGAHPPYAALPAAATAMHYPCNHLPSIHLSMHQCIVLFIHPQSFASAAAAGRVIHPYIHTYIHTCMHTYIHTYIHTASQQQQEESEEGLQGQGSEEIGAQLPTSSSAA
eukprot:scaffold255795_cov26-Tisochrysis_lutea.AAC.1